MGAKADVVSVKGAAAGELPMDCEVVGYQKTNGEYGKIYDRDARGIKRWTAKGRKAVAEGAGYMPPLDEPWKMPEWWNLHMSQKCPEHILKLAEETMPEDLKEDEAPSEPALESVDLSGVEGVNDMGLSLMQKVVAVRGKELAAAYAAGRGVDINSAEKRLNDAVKSLRMLEKTQADMAKSGGALLSKDMVRSEIVPVVNRLSTSFLPAIIRAIQRVAPQVSREDARAVAVEERDACFTVLKGSLLEVA